MTQVDLLPQEKEILHTFERGRRIQDTINSAGWRDILEMFDKRVKAAEQVALDPKLIDKEEIVALHRRAVTMRELFQNVVADASGAIEDARRIPQLIAPEVGEPGAMW